MREKNPFADPEKASSTLEADATSNSFPLVVFSHGLSGTRTTYSYVLGSRAYLHPSSFTHASSPAGNGAVKSPLEDTLSPQSSTVTDPVPSQSSGSAQTARSVSSTTSVPRSTSSGPTDRLLRPLSSFAFLSSTFALLRFARYSRFSSGSMLARERLLRRRTAGRITVGKVSSGSGCPPSGARSVWERREVWSWRDTPSEEQRRCVCFSLVPFPRIPSSRPQPSAPCFVSPTHRTFLDHILIFLSHLVDSSTPRRLYLLPLHPRNRTRPVARAHPSRTIVLRRRPRRPHLYLDSRLPPRSDVEQGGRQGSP